MKRATLIGEASAGAAHPVTKELVRGVFDVRLPYGRPINPVTGSDWEGTGVAPDIAVPAEEALKTAHLEAMRHLVAKCQDEKERRGLAWMLDILVAVHECAWAPASDLSRCAGEAAAMLPGYLAVRTLTGPCIVMLPYRSTSSSQ